MDFILSVWAHPQVKLAVAGLVGAACVDLRKWSQSEQPWSWKAFGKHAVFGLISGAGLGQAFG